MATIKTAKKDKKKAGIETWQWTGKNSRGEKVKGELMSANVDQVKNTLASQGIVVKRLRKKSALFGGSKRVSGKDVTMFARQMATMIRAGVPVLQAFGIVAESMKSPGMRHLVEDLMNQVGAGASFSEALRKHPQHFDNLFTNLVAAGEQAGALDKMLDRVATYKEKIDSLIARVKKSTLLSCSCYLCRLWRHSYIVDQGRAPVRDTFQRVWSRTTSIHTINPHTFRICAILLVCDFGCIYCNRHIHITRHEALR
ncbi:type II secretion system F family protein [Cobetia marina]